jgi:hypothetical protein
MNIIIIICLILCLYASIFINPVYFFPILLILFIVYIFLNRHFLKKYWIEAYAIIVVTISAISLYFSYGPLSSVPWKTMFSYPSGTSMGAWIELGRTILLAATFVVFYRLTFRKMFPYLGRNYIRPFLRSRFWQWTTALTLVFGSAYLAYYNWLEAPANLFRNYNNYVIAENIIDYYQNILDKSYENTYATEAQAVKTKKAPLKILDSHTNKNTQDAMKQFIKALQDDKVQHYLFYKNPTYQFALATGISLTDDIQELLTGPKQFIPAVKEMKEQCNFNSVIQSNCIEVLYKKKFYTKDNLVDDFFIAPLWPIGLTGPIETIKDFKKSLKPTINGITKFNNFLLLILKPHYQKKPSDLGAIDLAYINYGLSFKYKPYLTSYYLPYWSYSAYSFVNYLGLGVPIIFLFLFAISQDVSRTHLRNKKYLKSLPNKISKYKQAQIIINSQNIYEDIVLNSFEKHTYRFINLFGQYSWCILLFSLICLYEYLVASSTLSETALFWAYSVYLLPVSFVLLLLVALWLYENIYVKLAIIVTKNFKEAQIINYEEKYNPQIMGQRVYHTYLALLLFLMIVDAFPLIKGVLGQGLYDIINKIWSH